MHKQNRAYIYYTTENIMDDLGCARATCTKVIAEQIPEPEIAEEEPDDSDSSTEV